MFHKCDLNWFTRQSKIKNNNNSECGSAFQRVIFLSKNERNDDKKEFWSLSTNLITT